MSQLLSNSQPSSQHVQTTSVHPIHHHIYHYHFIQACNSILAVSQQSNTHPSSQPSNQPRLQLYIDLKPTLNPADKSLTKPTNISHIILAKLLTILSALKLTFISTVWLDLKSFKITLKPAFHQPSSKPPTFYPPSQARIYQASPCSLPTSISHAANFEPDFKQTFEQTFLPDSRPDFESDFELDFERLWARLWEILWARLHTKLREILWARLHAKLQERLWARLQATHHLSQDCNRLTSQQASLYLSQELS